jgi:LacI family transcriptional regulator
MLKRLSIGSAPVKTLSAIAKELQVSLATVSYVYHDRWREKRIHPDLAERVRRKLQQDRGMPDLLGRQLRSGRTDTVGLLLPHLDQPYYLKLLAGIEGRLDQADCMVLLGSSHWQWQSRQVQLLDRMLARRVDAVLMCPRPAKDLSQCLQSMAARPETPLVFLDNYLPECPTHRVHSDNRWGAREAVRAMLAHNRQRLVFFGADADIAALHDRFRGFADAIDEAGLKLPKSHIIWRAGREEAAIASLRRLLTGRNPPDGIFATSFLGFLPVLQLLDELGLRHPEDILLAGFDEPPESWAQGTVQRVIKQLLLTVVQSAAEMGRAAVEIALAARDDPHLPLQQRLIRPMLNGADGH